MPIAPSYDMLIAHVRKFDTAQKWKAHLIPVAATVSTIDLKNADSAS